MKNNQYKPVNNTGLRRILNASKFSWQGLRATYRSEAAFRQECYVGVLALPLSFFIADNVVEWVLLITSFLLVLLTEIINSAIEATVDRFGSERHELAGKAKDAGSAAVAVAIAIAVLTWLPITFL